MNRIPAPEVNENRNPMMDNEGTHGATARLKFISGRLYQLYMPCDTATHAPEWREVESVE